MVMTAFSTRQILLHIIDRAEGGFNASGMRLRGLRRKSGHL
jgi:hypothetical protein